MHSTGREIFLKPDSQFARVISSKFPKEFIEMKTSSKRQAFSRWLYRTFSFLFANSEEFVEIKISLKTRRLFIDASNHPIGGEIFLRTNCLIRWNYLWTHRASCILYLLAILEISTRSSDSPVFLFFFGKSEEFIETKIPLKTSRLFVDILIHPIDREILWEPVSTRATKFRNVCVYVHGSSHTFTSSRLTWQNKIPVGWIAHNHREKRFQGGGQSPFQAPEETGSVPYAR